VSSEPPHTPSRPHTPPPAQPSVQPQGQSHVQSHAQPPTQAHIQSHAQPPTQAHIQSHAQPSPVGAPTATHHDISTVLAREPCAGCGAPLGADQRYCLSCGIPRSGTRLPFLDVLHTEAAAAGVVEAGSQPASLLRMASLAPAGDLTSTSPGGWGGGKGGSPAARLREYTPLFALLGVLLLALLIGLLLGHWAGGGTKTLAVTPTKQVVEVKGIPTTAAPVLSAPAATSAATTPAPSSSGTGAGGGANATTSTPHATNPTVGKLAQTTGKEHAKEVEKALAKGGGTLSTGRAQPPKEPSKAEANKPIGGGSEVTSIE
jgi:hypothetical protein